MLWLAGQCHRCISYMQSCYFQSSCVQKLLWNRPNLCIFTSNMLKFFLQSSCIPHHCLITNCTAVTFCTATVALTQVTALFLQNCCRSQGSVPTVTLWAPPCSSRRASSRLRRRGAAKSWTLLTLRLNWRKATLYSSVLPVQVGDLTNNSQHVTLA